MISAITSKGQTTCARPFGWRWEWVPGIGCATFVYDNEFRLLPVRPLGRLFGALKHRGSPMSLEDMERGIAESACADLAAKTRRGAARSPSTRSIGSWQGLKMSP